MALDLSRQSEIVKGSPADVKLLIIGAGGIGSNVAYVSACMGFESIEVFDDQVVGPENVAPQFYAEEDDGILKVDALGQNIRLFIEDIDILGRPELYTRQKVEADIVIVGVDSMVARRQIWLHNQIKGWKWWIDGRMGGRVANVITVKNERPQWERYWNEYLDEKAWPTTEQSCGMKATAFMTKGIIPGLIGNTLAMLLNGEEPPFFQMFNTAIPQYIAKK